MLGWGEGTTEPEGPERLRLSGIWALSRGGDTFVLSHLNDFKWRHAPIHCMLLSLL